MKTILITGGAGFIGKNLLKYIFNTNIAKKAIVIDNFITSDKEMFLKFINRNKLCNVVDIYEGDICNAQDIQCVKEMYSHVDEIYHLASLASPKYYKKYPLHTLDVGYIGTKNILDMCVFYNAQKPCKLLFTSTSEVYGDPLPQFHPQKESYYGNVNTVGERSCYDESKRVAETLMHNYKNLYNIDIKIARIFNTYGPHMDIDDGRIVTEIIKSLFLQTTLHIFGDGLQTRSLCFVDDTVKMMVALMNTDCHAPVNMGSNHEITINELLQISIDIFKKHFTLPIGFPKVLYTQIDKDDPKMRKPCLMLNANVLGDHYSNNLLPVHEGMLKTMLYFSEEF